MYTSSSEKKLVSKSSSQYLLFLKDLASALQSAKPSTPKPKNNNTTLKNQLKNVKAGQAMSLQMVNGELTLSSTGKATGKQEQNKENPITALKEVHK